MNHTTELEDISEIYDAVQVGEIPKVNMGDTINKKYVVVDSVGNFTEIKEGEQYFMFTETIRNNSTKGVFEDSYVSTVSHPLDKRFEHFEVIKRESVEITI